MCGLSGVFDGGAAARSGELRAIAVRMADTLRHRGPDGGGVWYDPAARVALGHRRLAIIDLSAEGRQPMHSAERPLGDRVQRRDLQLPGAASASSPPSAVAFRGHSDTEVLLAAIERHGARARARAVRRHVRLRPVGPRERTLHLVRDRLGKKPLYFGWRGRSFVFGSELKALAAHPAFAPEVDRDALAAVPALPVHPGAALDLARRLQAAGRHAPRAAARSGRTAAASGPAGTHPAVLVRARGRRAGHGAAARERRGGRSTGSRRCCARRCASAWSPTCRSAPSSPAASIPRSWWR